jgi:hypothetical protein
LIKMTRRRERDLNERSNEHVWKGLVDEAKVSILQLLNVSVNCELVGTASDISLLEHQLQHPLPPHLPI